MLNHMIFFNNKKKNSLIFLTNTSFENEKKKIKKLIYYTAINYLEESMQRTIIQFRENIVEIFLFFPIFLNN